MRNYTSDARLKLSVGETRNRRALGQAVPAPNALIDLYAVPAGYSAQARVMVCNQDGARAKFRLAIAPAGESDDPKHYLYFDQVVPSNKTFEVDDLVLSETDVLRVWSDSSAVSFVAFGEELLG